MNEHTPQLSMWPPILGFAITMIAAGVLSTWIVSVLGIVLLLISVWNWAQENRLTSHNEEITVEAEESQHE